MTTLPHFTIPQNLAAYTAAELHTLTRNIGDWLTHYDAGNYHLSVVIDDRASHLPIVVIERVLGMAMQAEAGDMLIIDDKPDEDGNRLRFATMEEQHRMHEPPPAPEPDQFELIYQELNGNVGQAVVTADTVTSDEHYLMFLIGNGIVHAVPHRSVVEFNQISVHQDNIESGDGTPVQLGTADHSTLNKFMP